MSCSVDIDVNKYAIEFINVSLRVRCYEIAKLPEASHWELKSDMFDIYIIHNDSLWLLVFFENFEFLHFTLKSFSLSKISPKSKHTDF